VCESGVGRAGSAPELVSRKITIPADGYLLKPNDMLSAPYQPTLRGGGSDSASSPFVTTGLDPVVMLTSSKRNDAALSEPNPRMDCRVKPGNDDAKNHSRGADASGVVKCNFALRFDCEQNKNIGSRGPPR
jgi:hypothetical protein